MHIRYRVVLAATMLINFPAHALKLMSPQAVCQQRGLQENSPEWDACIQEATANNDRITREFYAGIEGTSAAEPVHPEAVVPQQKSAYDFDNNYLVPPLMRKALKKKLLFTPEAQAK
jgi:hypothetical protein